MRSNSPIFELLQGRKRPLPESATARLEREADEAAKLSKPVERDNRRLAWERSLGKAA